MGALRTTLLCLAALIGAGCKQEPTIVITFAPPDLTARPADLARPAPAVDAAAARLDGAAHRLDAGAAAAAPAKDRCKTAADCVVAKADCCGCAGGGKAIAIARSRAGAWVRELGQKCGPTTVCIAVMSTDPSCSSVAACVGGTCELAPPKREKK